mgnify:CR=1 FL=1
MESERNNRLFVVLAIGIGGLLILGLIGLIGFLVMSKPNVAKAAFDDVMEFLVFAQHGPHRERLF